MYAEEDDVMDKEEHVTTLQKLVGTCTHIVMSDMHMYLLRYAFTPSIFVEFADGYIPDLADLMKYVTQKELVDDFLRLIEQLLTVLLGDEMASAQMVRGACLLMSL